MVRRAACALLLVSGCSLITDNFVVNGFSGDEFPIDVDTSSGAIVVGIREAGVSDRVAVLDLLSPVTLTDPGPDGQAAVTYPALTLLGQDGPGGPIDRPRALLSEAQLIASHPCQTDECDVGPASAPRGYEAIVGANVLAGDAVRVDLGADELFLLPDVGGDETSRSLACDAVLPAPFRGGGTLVIGGTELPFGGRRMAVGSCIAADPDPTLLQSQRGTDALFVISTGIGISILGRSAYDRYAAQQQITTPFELLPIQSVYLPSGLISGSLTTLPRVALVANSPGAPRAPCRQVYSHHLLTDRDCIAPGTICVTNDDCPSHVCQSDNTCEEDCPCDVGQTSCFVPAMVEIDPPAGIDVLIVSDNEPTLQSLRTELRPDQPEVDGILGTNALRTVELDVDYTHDRLLGRCTDTSCDARPELPSSDQRAAVRGCLHLP
jgi:hypothetical protein